MEKNLIDGYSTTLSLIRGFLIALLASSFLYLAWLDLSYPLIDSIFAIGAFYLLLKAQKRVWFFSGFFIAIFWFWWISMSFRYYGFPWAIPIGIFSLALLYAILFWIIAFLAQKIQEKTPLHALWIKAILLLSFSYLHPFGFDWFKPELLFVQSFIGIEKWHFAIVLIALVLFIHQKKILYLVLLLFAYQPSSTIIDTKALPTTTLVTTYISINDKWNPALLSSQIALVKEKLQQSIKEKKKLIIFPESVLPIYLNKDQELIDFFTQKSHLISIVIGALYNDSGIPRNSSYIFDKGTLEIANKVILVPFGENNPLPDWLGKIVNAIFYDGAIDYQASSTVSDYIIDNKTYRNAICYEACSEKLYSNTPKEMIVMSNNGWFTPSIQPTQQRLLLQYYSRKYKTKIYHSSNMSQSYLIYQNE